MPASVATFSAVRTIETSAPGSQPKLSNTQFSASGVAPGASGLGHTRCGPLLVRSAVMARRHRPGSSSTSMAPLATTRADVAQAWLIVGPVRPPAPIMPATQPAP